jgi:hypothetical protein
MEDESKVIANRKRTQVNYYQRRYAQGWKHLTWFGPGHLVDELKTMKNRLYAEYRKRQGMEG